MDRLSTGEKIAGGSAVLLFIFMFFDWFKVDVSSGDGLFSLSIGGSAWEAFSYTDLFLMLTIIVAVAVAVIRLVRRPGRAAGLAQRGGGGAGRGLGAADPLPDHRPARRHRRRPGGRHQPDASEPSSA